MLTTLVGGTPDGVKVLPTKIDPTFSALRVTNRPIEALGFYSIGVATSTYGGLLANDPIFSMRWGTANRFFILLRFNIHVIVTTTASTPGVVDRRLVVARNFTASDSGQTAVTLTGNSFKLRTSYPSTLITDMRVSGGGAITAGTRTLDANGIGLVQAEMGTTALTAGLEERVIDPYDLFNAVTASQPPLVLQQNEGLIVDMPTAEPASASLISVFNMVWAEANNY